MPAPAHRRRLSALALATLALGTPAAAAAESASDLPPWRLSGYGTLSYSRDDRGDLAAIRDFTQRPSNSQNTGATWRLDSRLGLQLAYRFAPRVEGVVQAVARDQINNSVSNSVDLAYLDFQLGPRDAARLGRIGYAPFLMSDHRNLGYAYPWVRPPREFYSWLPLFSFDGGELTHDVFDGDGRWRLRAQFGRSGFDIPMGGDTFAFKADQLWSLSLAHQRGPWRLQAGLSGFRSRDEASPLATLHDGLEQLAGLNLPGISAEAAQLRRDTSFGGSRIRYYTLGAAYDDGTWLGQAELGYSQTSTVIATASRSGYLAVGRRFGDWLPYLLLSASRPDKPVRTPESDWGMIGQAAFQTIAYGVANSTRQDQETLSLGSRWDFNSRAAFKLQWDHSRIHPQGYALWFRSPETNARASTVNLLTASLDFVF